MDNNKQYYVQLPDAKQGMMVDADKFESKRDQLYKEHPDAIVMEMTNYTGKEEGLNAENSMYHVQLPGAQQGMEIDYDKFHAKKDELFAKYPNAQVNVLRNIDLAGEKAVQQEKAINDFDMQNQGFMDEYDRQQSIINDSISSPEAKAKAADYTVRNNQQYNALTEQRNALVGEYDNNPSVIRKQYEFNEQNANELNGEIERLKKMYNKLSAEDEAEYMQKMANPKFLDVLTSISENAPTRVRGTRSMLSPTAYAGTKNEQERKTLNAAIQLDMDSRDLYDSIKKDDIKKTPINKAAAGLISIIGGAYQRGANPEFWNDIAAAENGIELYNLHNKVLGIIGSYDKINEADMMRALDEKLSPAEQELLKAYLRSGQAIQDNGHYDENGKYVSDVHWTFNAGGSIMDSAKMMAEMMAFSGVTQNAMKGATDGMLKWFAGKATGATSKLGRAAINTAGKIAIGEMRAVVGGAIQTAMAPSTYVNLAKSINQINDDGQLVKAGEAIVAGLTDSFIENASEFGLGMANDITRFAGKNTARLLGHTSWGQLYTKGVGEFLERAGIKGLAEEWGEELNGAYQRALLGRWTNGKLGDANALKDFWTVENQLTLLASFAPTIGGGAAISEAQRRAAGKKMEKSRINLQNTLLKNGYSLETINNIVTSIGGDSPYNLVHNASPYLKPLFEQTPSYETYKAVTDYISASAKALEYGARYGMLKDQMRSEQERKLNESMQDRQWWMDNVNDKGYNAQTAREITLDGKTGYVVGVADNGTLNVAWTDGTVGFVDEATLQDGINNNTATDSGAMQINQFLDYKAVQDEKIKEQIRMQQEYEQQIEQVKSQCQPGASINLGTVEQPNNFVVTQTGDSKAILQNPTTGEVREMPYAELSPYTGVSTDVKTDDQINEEESDAIVSMDDARIKMDNLGYNGNVQFDKDGQKYTLMAAIGWETSEDGTSVLQVFATDNTGTSDLLYLTTDEVASIIGSNENMQQSAENTQSNDEQNVVTDEQEPADTTTDYGVLRDFRGNAIPLKSDGKVDQNAFWNADPEAWAKWKTEQLQDKGAYAIDYIGKAVKKLQEAIKVIDKTIAKETDFDNLDKLEGEKNALTERINTLAGITQNLQIDALKQQTVIDEEAKKKAEEEAAAESAKREEERKAAVGDGSVPDWTRDKASDARKRGFRIVNGEKVYRQKTIPAIKGKEVIVKFGNNDDQKVKAVWAIVLINYVQPSHIKGKRNPLYFITETQPKDRTDEASIVRAQQIAINPNPQELVDGVTAYAGAPVINEFGELPQGNNRGDAIKQMYENYPDKAKLYKDYVMSRLTDFDFDENEVKDIEHEQFMLTRMLVGVSDEETIRLGQMTAQDTESGGTQRIDAARSAKALGDKFGRYAGILLATPDDVVESLPETVNRNARAVIDYLSRLGIINPTQVQSCYDAKGNVTAEAKQDLLDILKQDLFNGGVNNLPMMFDAMPANAQKAILSTLYRDMESEKDSKVKPDIQEAVEVMYFAMQDADFAGAKNYEEAKARMEAWKRQVTMDESSPEGSFVPMQRYSNFAIDLATKFKVGTQKYLTSLFNEFFNLVQGVGGDMFNPAIKTDKATAAEKVFNVKLNNNDKRTEDGSAETGGGETGTGRGQGSAGSIESEQNAGRGTADGRINKIFGTVYNQFKGKAKEAIDFLLKVKEGKAVGALHHKEIGDIDLWYGNDEAGLKKIADKHPEVLDVLQSAIDEMSVVTSSENRIILESETHKAVISKKIGDEKTDNWLLSAYEKKGVSGGSSDINPEPVGLQNGTAPLQNALSEGKDTNDFETANQNAEKERAYKAGWDGIYNPVKAQIADGIEWTAERARKDAVKDHESYMSKSNAGNRTAFSDEAHRGAMDAYEAIAKELEQEPADNAQDYENYLEDSEESDIQDMKDALMEDLLYDDNDKYQAIYDNMTNNEVEELYNLISEDEIEAAEKLRDKLLKKYKKAGAKTKKKAEPVKPEKRIQAPLPAKYKIHVDYISSGQTFSYPSIEIFKEYDKYAYVLNVNPDNTSAEERQDKVYSEFKYNSIDEAFEAAIPEVEKEIERQKYIYPQYSYKDAEGSSKVFNELLKARRAAMNTAGLREKAISGVKWKKEYEQKFLDLLHGKKIELSEYTKKWLETWKDNESAYQRNLKDAIQHAIFQTHDWVSYGYASEDDINKGIELGKALLEKEEKDSDTYKALTMLVKSCEEAKMEIEEGKALAKDIVERLLPYADKKLKKDYHDKTTKELITLIIELSERIKTDYKYKKRLVEEAIGKIPERLVEFLAEMPKINYSNILSSINEPNNNRKIAGEPEIITSKVGKQEYQILKYWNIWFSGYSYNYNTGGGGCAASPCGEFFETKIDALRAGVDMYKKLAEAHKDNAKDYKSFRNMVEVLQNAIIAERQKEGYTPTEQEAENPNATYSQGSLFGIEDMAKEVAAENIKAEAKRRGQKKPKATTTKKVDETATMFEQPSQPVQTEQKEQEQPKQEEPKQEYGASNTLVTKDRYEELKLKMRNKLNNLNAGFDPETFAIGCEMAAYHMEAGARSFVDFCKRMIADLGDAVRPYLKSFYNGSRDLPGMEELSKSMDDYNTVSSTDVNAITLDEPEPPTTPTGTDDTTNQDDEETKADTKYKAGDKVVYNGQEVSVDSVNNDGTYNLVYDPSGYLPNYFMGIDESDVSSPSSKEQTKDEQPVESKNNELYKKFYDAFHETAQQIYGKVNEKQLQKAIDDRMNAIDEYAPLIKSGAKVEKGKVDPYQSFIKCKAEIDVLQEMLDGTLTSKKNYKFFEDESPKQTETNDIQKTAPKATTPIVEINVGGQTAKVENGSVYKDIDEYINNGYRFTYYYNDGGRKMYRAQNEQQTINITKAEYDYAASHGGKMMSDAEIKDKEEEQEEKNLRNMFIRNWPHVELDDVINTIKRQGEEGSSYRYLKDLKRLKELTETSRERNKRLISDGKAYEEQQPELITNQDEITDEKLFNSWTRKGFIEYENMSIEDLLKELEKEERIFKYAIKHLSYGDSDDYRAQVSTIKQVITKKRRIFVVDNEITVDKAKSNLPAILSDDNKKKFDRLVSGIIQYGKDSGIDEVNLIKKSKVYRSEESDFNVIKEALNDSLQVSYDANLHGYVISYFDIDTDTIYNIGRFNLTGYKGSSHQLWMWRNKIGSQTNDSLDSKTISVPQQDNSGVIGTIVKDKHTKTGEDIWYVKPSRRVNADVFKNLKAKAKEFDGYWSSFGKKSGFLFKSEEDANNFNNSNIEGYEKVNEQRPASTSAVVSEAGSVAQEAATVSEDANSKPSQLQHEIDKIDKILAKINEKLALLGNYPVDKKSKWDEQYEYLRSAERLAIDDMETLAKSLCIDLGLPFNLGIKAESNIAPIGGFVTISFPLLNNKTLRLEMMTGATEGNASLELIRLVWGIEDSSATSIATRYGLNNLEETNVTYNQLLEHIKDGARMYLPEQQTEITEVAKDIAKKNNEKKNNNIPLNGNNLMGDLFADLNIQEDNDNKYGFKVGDKARFTLKGRDNKIVTIVDIEKDGRPVVDSFGVNWMEEITDWEWLEPISEKDNIEPKNVNDNDRLDERNAGSDAQVGEGEQQTSEGPAGQRVDRDGSDNPVYNGVGGSIASGNNQGNGDVKKSKTRKNTHNNHQGKNEVVLPKTPAARFKANVDAIRTMRRLVDSEHPATKEDMAVLRMFTGWGGLGGYFKNTYTSDYAELKELLSPEEFEDAVMSVNSAYFTPEYVVDSLWSIAKKLGFTGGNILEGSAGIGNILAVMPKDISESSDITAVEIEPVTGNILKLLYPDANVQIKGFQDVAISSGTVDLAITNVPFVTGLKVIDEIDKDLSNKFSNIHDFCIAKNLRKLAEGGIGIFITTKGTLDSNSSKKLRAWITGEGNCDVIGAYRLNNDTFEGTTVTSDIIVIRKRIGGIKSSQAIDISKVDIERESIFKDDKNATYSYRDGKYVIPEYPVVMEYNNYFIEHPENMGGDMAFAFEKCDTFRPTSIGLYPNDNIDQAKSLSKWISGFKQESRAESLKPQDNTVHNNNTEKAIGKEGQIYVNRTGEICTIRGGVAIPMEGKQTKVHGYARSQVVKDYDGIKNALQNALDVQTKTNDDAELNKSLKALNYAYDSFVKRYGHLNNNVSLSWLRNDVDYAQTVAIETYKETENNGKKEMTYGKTDVFSKRVLGIKAEPKPTNIKDGIIVSINRYGTINTPYIAETLGINTDDARDKILETRMAYENPVTGMLEPSYIYLSGNVREKLRYAGEMNVKGKYNDNIEALKKVIPADIPAILIEFSIGSDWIDKSLYTDFCQEKYDTNVNFACAGGRWFTDGINNYDKQRDKNKSAGVHSDYLDMDAPGTTLMLCAMNNTPFEFTKTIKYFDGTSETLKDQNATAAAAVRVQEIREEFKEWCRNRMLQDTELSNRMTELYNDAFNNYAPIVIGDEFVPTRFDGQVLTMGNKPFELRPHQKNAVIRATIEPVLLAHEVGSGKTYTLISSAMEMKRLGTAKKPMIVVQNATVGQFVTSAKQLYPNARILTVNDKDRTKEGRIEFYSKIKYNDWDMIIVPQSVFEMIPDSPERKIEFISEKIDEKIEALIKAREAKMESRQLASMEKEKVKLEEERNKIIEDIRNDKKGQLSIEVASIKAKRQIDRRQDQVDDFDKMGIDALLIDEAHAYKRLGFETTIKRGVKGVDKANSKRSAGVYMKLRSIFDRCGWKNVVFATGTPISNTAAEIWTFMKYLMKPDVMKANHIYFFDDFVRNFGNISQNFEHTTSGKVKDVTRFAAYNNVPELVRIWASVSDTVRTVDAENNGGGKLKDEIPEMETGKAIDKFLEQTPSLVGIMNSVRAELDRYEQMSGKEKLENSYIPLVMFGIAKRAAIDARLVSPNAKDEPNSKTNNAVNDILADLKETKSYNGTIAVFCDNFRRVEDVNGKKVETFNLFNDIKQKLINNGVPESQIVIMTADMSTNKKEQIFSAVNAGDVRVIMGTTQTLGTGVNIQERLHMAVHIDAPVRPMDYTQRNGRLLRQGNLHKQWGKTVKVLRYGVKDSLDVTAYQRLKTKAGFIDSIMNGKHYMHNAMSDRTLEEEEEGMFDNPVALLSGSQFAVELTKVERELRKYSGKKEQHRQDQIYIENTTKRNAKRIPMLEEKAKLYRDAIKKYTQTFKDGKPNVIVINGVKYTGNEELQNGIRQFVNTKIKQVQRAIEYNSSRYTSFRQTVETIDISFDGIPVKVDIDGRLVYSSADGKYKADVTYKYYVPELESGEWLTTHDATSLKNVIEQFTNDFASTKILKYRLNKYENEIETLKQDNANMESRRGKPFEFEDKLDELTKRADEVRAAMRAELEENEKKYAAMAAEQSDLKDISYDDEEGDEPEEHNLEVEDIPADIKRLDPNDVIATASPINAINRLVKITGVPVEWIDDKDVKGKYIVGKNKVYLNIANHTSTTDIVETYLHETIGHYGLRKLFGDKFNDFIDKVYELGTVDIKRRIDGLMSANGWTKAYATEEYLAKLASKTDLTKREKTFWDKVKALFNDVLSAITGARKMDITDDTLVNILAASFRNLEEEAHNTINDSKTELELINDRFNAELKEQKEHKQEKGHIYQLGMPGDILLSTGFPNLPIELSAIHLKEKSEAKRHPFDIMEMKNLVKEINKPIAVFSYGDYSKAQNVIVELQKDGKNFLVSIHFNQERNGNVVSSIRGLYNKDNAEWINWISKDKLLYVDKKRIQDLINQQQKNLADVEYLDLNLVAKIINDFENPIYSGEKINAENSMFDRLSKMYDDYNDIKIDAATFVSEFNDMYDGATKSEQELFKPIIEMMRQAEDDYWETGGREYANSEDIMETIMGIVDNNSNNINDSAEEVRFSKVTDKDVIDWFDKQPKILTYKTVAVEANGEMHAPMADNVSKTSGLKDKVKTGNYIFGELLKAEENPDLVDEKGHIKIQRTDGKTLNVAYDPYDHSSDSMINDQFKSAWERDNLRVIEEEIAQGDLDEHYKADKALLPTGLHNWKAGVVGRQLPESDMRHVYLARYSRPKGFVDWSKVAQEWIDKCTKYNISVPFNVVPKAIINTIADAGVTIIEPENGMGQNCIDAYNKWKQSRNNGITRDRTTFPSDRRTDESPMEFNRRVMNFYNRNFKAITEMFVLPKNVTAEEIVNTTGISLENANSIVNKIKENNINGFYNPKKNKILLIANDRKSANDVLRTLFHENFHAFIENRYLNIYGNSDEKNRERLKYVDSLWKKIEYAVELKFGSDYYEQITKLAERNPEEFPVHALTRAMADNRIEEFLDELYLWDKKFVIDFINSIGYATERQTGTEQAEGTQLPEAAAGQDDGGTERWSSGLYNLSSRYKSAKETADRLGISVKFVSRNEMPKDHEWSMGVWHNGQILICLANNPNANEAIKTVLHEGVGHEGLRKLIGSEYVHSFCMEVYKKLPIIRKGVIEHAMRKNSWDMATAVEEHLATLAQRFDMDKEFNDNLWDKVRIALRNILSKIGINVPLTERDLRWLLYQNYYALHNNLQTEANRARLAHRLGFSQSALKAQAEVRQIIRDREMEELKNAASEYNIEVANPWVRLSESLFNKDNSVGKLVAAMEKATGKIAKSFEDIRLALNHQGATGEQQLKDWEKKYWEPLLDSVKSIADKLGVGVEDIERYMMLKHGRERNDVLAARDARRFYQNIHDANVQNIMEDESMKDEDKKKEIEKEDKKLDKHISEIDAKTDKLYLKNREKDYGGLTGLYSEYPNGIPNYSPGNETIEEYYQRVIQERKPIYDNVADMEIAAEKECEAFEQQAGKALIDELWNRTNAATKATLKHQYDYNMISRAQYDNIKGMFEYYIPLRGFADKTAADLYSYYTSESGNQFQAPVLSARGRVTRANSPLGYIGAQASSGIAQDLKNNSKLALWYFVNNRPDTNLITISDVWRRKKTDENGNVMKDENGNVIIENVYPPFTESLTTEEAKAEYRKWENEMKDLRLKGLAFHGMRDLDKLHLNYVINQSKDQRNSHVITLKVGGVEKFMFINGNPRAAQALNNELNINVSDEKLGILKGIAWFNRLLASLYTTYRPEFIISNLQRDMLTSLMSVDINENDEYKKAFKKNLKHAIKTVKMHRQKSKDKLAKGYYEDMYEKFVNNGGVTGYTRLADDQRWEAEARRYAARIDDRLLVEKGKKLFELISDASEGIEQMYRFCAFLTSMEQGKDISQAVADAKDITVNFNRKGSGKIISLKEADQLRWKNGKKLNELEKGILIGVSALNSTGRRLFIFWNATMQALSKHAQMFVKNPKKMGFKWTMMLASIGALQAILHSLLDDDDEYLDLPDWERHNNMMIGANGLYFKWALPQETRIAYGLGDMFATYAMGRYPHKNFAGEAMKMISAVMPLDLSEGLIALAPTGIRYFAEIAKNQDYKGSRIYKDNKYLTDAERKATPNWNNAFQNTGNIFVAMSRVLNAMTGGDDVKAGWINIHPESIEHLYTGYTGGIGTTIEKLYQTIFGPLVYGATNGKKGNELQVNRIPGLSALFRLTDERYRNTYVNDLYWYYKGVSETVHKNIDGYIKAGNTDRALEIMNSDDYKAAQVFDLYKKNIKMYDDVLKMTTDKEERKKLTKEQDALKADMIQKIGNIDNKSNGEKQE